MTHTEMEDAIKSLNKQVASVEQILPTLATREDLLGTAADLRAELVTTREDLHSEIESTRSELHAEILNTRRDLHAEILSTRAELHADIVATKDDLSDRIEAVKLHTDVRIEDARDDIRRVAEGVAALSTSLQANTRVLEDVVARLDRHETILDTLVKRST